ncbi:hypothetical protein R6Q59_017386 [Mikania micrantha]|uniref:H15 domain-containing protein n=1 Tax=Mikania micrantha TaxID=192012 RepID=A0A5N6M4C2_9ASTR|nr:hypothetical protein E3N88_36472 [Mikania micrantha]
MAAAEPVTENPAATPAKVTKVKKARKPSAPKTKSPALHPPYFEMIKDAIVTLKERTGSSPQAISKFIEGKYKNLPSNFRKLLSTQLKKNVAAGKLVKVKASFKLPPKIAPTTTGSSAPVKKPAAKAKAPAKKKTTSVKPKAKAPAAKAKPAAPKAKPAAKPKATATTKAKPAAKASVKPKTSVKPAAKSTKTSSRSKPGRTAAAAKPASKKTPVKKAAAKKTAAPKKAAGGSKKVKK